MNTDVQGEETMHNGQRGVWVRGVFIPTRQTLGDVLPQAFGHPGPNGSYIAGTATIRNIPGVTYPALPPDPAQVAHARERRERWLAHCLQREEKGEQMRRYYAERGEVYADGVPDWFA